MSGRLSPAWRLRATAAALLLPPLVHLVSLDRLTRWINCRALARSPERGSDLALAEWVDRVLKRLPPPWKHTCLKRALVLHYLLRRAGRPVDLLVGVRRDEAGALAAHAWLAREGKVCLEPGTEQVESFQVLTTFPAAPRKS